MASQFGIIVPTTLVSEDFSQHKEESVRPNAKPKSLVKPKIITIYGPMFSGKTLELILTITKYYRSGRRCVVIKNKKDIRYDADEKLIQTHDGYTLKVDTDICFKHRLCGTLKSDNASDLIHDQNKYDGDNASALDETQYIENLTQSLCEEYSQYDVIAIDEGQFFTKDDLYYFTTTLVRKLKKVVIIAGLLVDANQIPFPSMQNIICHSDEMRQYNAVCDDCGDDAIYTWLNQKKPVEENDNQVNEINNESKSSENQTGNFIKIGGKGMYIPLCAFCFDTRQNSITDSS